MNLRDLTEHEIAELDKAWWGLPGVSDTASQIDDIARWITANHARPEDFQRATELIDKFCDDAKAFFDRARRLTTSSSSSEESRQTSES